MERLNGEYQAMISVKVDIKSIYSYMVHSENYRVLSKFEYNWKETPIRSGRIAVPPAVTDVEDNHDRRRKDTDSPYLTDVEVRSRKLSRKKKNSRKSEVILA